MSGANLESRFMGKAIKDLNRDELLLCVEFFMDSERKFALYQDSSLKEENARLVKENEKLWKCLQKQ